LAFGEIEGIGEGGDDLRETRNFGCGRWTHGQGLRKPPGMRIGWKG
jgi:hypothetical protein